jgi:hypothetical protein
MDVSLRIQLGRIRTIISPVTRLVAILARPISWWNIGTNLPRSILWERNHVPLAKTSLSLILLLRWAIPDVGSRWTILSFGYYWSLRLRSTCLKISFIAFVSNINLMNSLKVIHLLLPIDFINLGEIPLLKLIIFLASVSTNLGAYLARLLNA